VLVDLNVMDEKGLRPSTGTLRRKEAPRGKVMLFAHDAWATGLPAAKEIKSQGADTIVVEFTSPHVLTATPNTLTGGQPATDSRL